MLLQPVIVNGFIKFVPSGFFFHKKVQIHWRVENEELEEIFLQHFSCDYFKERIFFAI